MKKIIISFIVLAVAFSLTASIRVVSYNALNFSGNDADRLAFFEAILNDIDADICLFQEIEDNMGAELLLSAVNNGTSDFSGSVFINGPDTNNYLVYRNSLITFGSQDTVSTALRDISEYELIIDGNLIRFYSCHLKASTGYENERLEEVAKLRDHINLLPAGTEFIIVGDMNFYTSSEPGYQKFIADESNNISRAEDLSDQVGDWHNNSDYEAVHTQSTRSTQFGGGASGGLDDRFDFIFSSYQLNNGYGLEYIEDTITSYGNDGAHFNVSINYGTNSVVSPEIADALYFASDHLPVFAEFNTINSSQPLIVVSIPNIEEDWQQGTEHTIEWASANFGGNVKIELLNETSEDREILVTSTENDGEWIWNIPEDATLGAYRIAISDNVDDDPIDVSNNPFYIIEPTSEHLIYDIQYSVDGPSPMEGVEVITNGIVTGASDNIYFLQDGIGAWNGIFVYDYAHGVNEGDEINITANVEEYFEKTELTDVVEYSIISSGNDLPEVVSLSTIDVNQEDYEGVLVHINNAECTDYNPTYGEWLVDDGSGAIMINDMIYAFEPTIGEVYEITGLVDYAYGSYRIEPRYSSDINIASSANEDVVNIDFNLSNYPNPFNPTTTISFEVRQTSSFITLEVFNLKGQEVKQLISTQLQAGKHSVIWNGTDSNDQPVSSGIYFYKLISGEHKQTKKMLLLK
ncbi:MAG: T9SS type A sorting domain-containing protein [Candidatus Cloacimonetes bacterium]|jgi:endonuclease/exonuclease/phosphatase family metal-dependent hydrolase|nr:T9SS type A sorting domain-containing protein [Candidatus Cloacimonadota bacterium]MBT5420761.1 T9SS type A sorting domain-containing protein [Candidatus Cloacimonadota bacterium]